MMAMAESADSLEQRVSVLERELGLLQEQAVRDREANQPGRVDAAAARPLVLTTT